MKKSSLKSFCYIFLLISLIFIIAGTILVGLHFNYTHMNWTTNGYSALGALELSSIIFAFCVIMFGFIVIICLDQNPFIIIFIILSLLSSVFIFAIGIFIFSCTKNRYFHDYYGCNTNYKGLFKIWKSVDVYLQLADEYLCSEECPCGFNSTLGSIYTKNSSTSVYYNMYSRQDNDYLPKNFPSCGDTVINKVYDEYLEKNAYFTKIFKANKFHKYWKHIEENFKCTGFCSLTYYNSHTKTNQKIVKYLFSDLSDGIPEHFGCMESLLDWVRKTLNAFGSLCMFIFLFLFILFVLGIMMVFAEDDEFDSENSSEVNSVIKNDEEAKKKEKEKLENERRLEEQRRKEEERRKKEEEEKKKRDEELEKKRKEEELEKLNRQKAEEERIKKIHMENNINKNATYVPPKEQEEEENDGGLRFHPSSLKQ